MPHTCGLRFRPTATWPSSPTVRVAASGMRSSGARSTPFRRARRCRRCGSRSIGQAAGRRIATRTGGEESVTTARRTTARRSQRSSLRAPRPTDWELDVSHWTGPLADLEVHADWAFNGEVHNLFGRLLYGGVSVHGFHTVKGTGAPKDRYGRSLYINTLDSAYGPGWKRETSIVFRNPTGVFCYSFWPTNDVSLPGSPHRPAGHGSKYRIEVEGPGVTPNLGVVVQDPGASDPSDPDKMAYQRQMKARQLQLSAGDKFCPTQT